MLSSSVRSFHGHDEALDDDDDDEMMMMMMMI